MRLWQALALGGVGLVAFFALLVFGILRLTEPSRALNHAFFDALRAIPGMLSAIALLLIVIYVFAILSIQLFGEQCYAGYLDQCTYFFGTLSESLFTLFQIMTLESWSHGIVRPITDVHPWAHSFFVLYVVMTAFAALNLFIGVVVNAMDSANEAHHSEDDEPTLKDLQNQIAELKEMMANKS